MLTNGRSIPYPKSHPTGQAYLRWNGKCKYFGKYGTAEADKKYWQWRNEIECGASAESQMLVGDLIAEFGKQSIPFNRDKLKAIADLGPLARLKVSEYSPISYRKHRERMASTGTRCARYVNDLMRLVQRIFRWGVSMGMVSLDAYTRLKTVDPLRQHEVKKQSTVRKPALRSDVEATLTELAPVPAAIVQLLLYTGARPGEICQMRASEVDKGGPNGTWVYRPSEHKTLHHGKRRFIVFGSKGQAILKEHWPAAGDYFFPSAVIVGPYKPASLKQAVEHACKRAGVPHWTPYQLRHLRMTELAVDKGLAMASVIANHGEQSTTKLYVHEPDEQQLREAV